MKIAFHIQLRRAILAAGLVLFCASRAAMAQDAIAETSLDEDRLLLEQEQRRDLDAHFTYAAKAIRERNAREAEWALRNMLQENPSLDRVKLELALVLVPQGKFAEAKVLLEDVKASNPPPEVMKNIETMLATVNKLMAPHQLSGGMSFGVNYDTNANSAPSSGDITVLDTSIPLGEGAMSESDTQMFGAVNINHVYRHDIDPNSETLRWKTDFLTYGTEQSQLDALDLQLYSIRTGPEITYLDTGVRVGLFANYTSVMLNGHDYLDNPKLEAKVDVPLSTSLQWNLGSSYEYRNYHNAPTVSTYEDRNGSSIQLMTGLRYALNDQWLLNLDGFVRQEDAKQLYYANDQYSFSGGVTYLVTPDTFINTQGSYRYSSYEEADPLISTMIRSDREYSAGISVGHSFQIPGYGDRIIVTAGYQYRDVQSNIQNYSYDNHRIMTAVSVAF
jgi:hypothetical protein